MDEDWRGENRVIKEAVRTLPEVEEESVDLFGIPTGTRLDELFYSVTLKDGKPERKPLGGLPYQSVMNIVGVPDTGKSVFGEQFAVYQAGRGYPTVFVTVEAPARFLIPSLKQKALALNQPWEKVEENMLILDASQSWELRNSLGSFTATLRHAIRRKRAKIVVIDSITGLYEHREMLARQIVREVYNLLKQEGVTALMISQKRSGQGADTAEAAGGLAVAHITDGTIIFSKLVIDTPYLARVYATPLGHVLRTLRIDGCRMAAHDTREHVFTITDMGLIEIDGTLAEYVEREKKKG